MAGNRKAFENVMLDAVERIFPGGGNAELYRTAFADMSDDEFEKFVQRLERRELRLPIVCPNFSKESLSVERNLQLAKEWGHNFFESLVINTGADGITYLTPQKYLILELNMRRQAQTLKDKIAIPKNANTVDDLTGQAAGDSKSSRLSYSEMQILSSQDLEDTIEELIKPRGGDVKAFEVMLDTIDKTGTVDLNELRVLGTQTKVSQALSRYLTGMHLSNTM